MANSHYLEGNIGLNIGRGLIKGTESIHKFGAVPAMSQNQTGTIWDKNDTVYPWSAFDTAGILVAAQANAQIWSMTPAMACSSGVDIFARKFG